MSESQQESPGPAPAAAAPATGETPRTDALLATLPPVYNGPRGSESNRGHARDKALVEHARQLERELHKAWTERNGYQEDWSNASCERDEARELLAEAVKERDEATASCLIDAWVTDKGRKIPWAKAVQIVAIVTKQPDEERDRLLRMGDEDGACEMCGRSGT